MMDYMFVGRRSDNHAFVAGRSIIQAIDPETEEQCVFIAQSNADRERHFIAPVTYCGDNLVKIEYLFYKVDPASVRLIAEGNV